VLGTGGQALGVHLLPTASQRGHNAGNVQVARLPLDALGQHAGDTGPVHIQASCSRGLDLGLIPARCRRRRRRRSRRSLVQRSRTSGGGSVKDLRIVGLRNGELRPAGHRRSGAGTVHRTTDGGHLALDYALLVARHGALLALHGVLQPDLLAAEVALGGSIEVGPHKVMGPGNASRRTRGVNGCGAFPWGGGQLQERRLMGLILRSHSLGSAFLGKLRKEIC